MPLETSSKHLLTLAMALAAVGYAATPTGVAGEPVAMQFAENQQVYQVFMTMVNQTRKDILIRTTEMSGAKFLPDSPGPDPIWWLRAGLVDNFFLSPTQETPGPQSGRFLLTEFGPPVQIGWTVSASGEMAAETNGNATFTVKSSVQGTTVTFTLCATDPDEAMPAC